MKSILQAKLSEDQQESAKTNQKSTILFNEMVRLGKELETSQERIQILQNLYDNRI